MFRHTAQATLHELGATDALLAALEVVFKLDKALAQPPDDVAPLAPQTTPRSNDAATPTAVAAARAAIASAVAALHRAVHTSVEGIHGATSHLSARARTKLYRDWGRPGRLLLNRLIFLANQVRTGQVLETPAPLRALRGTQFSEPEAPLSDV